VPSADDPPGVVQVEFTGTPRAGTEGEIAQAAAPSRKGARSGREVLVDLDWMSSPDPSGCAFRVS
jgi:hypothetical protein